MERHYSDLLVKLVWFEGLCWSISTSSPDPRLVFSVCDPIEPQNHKPAGVGGTTCCVVLILWCVLKDYSQTLLPGERSSPSSPGEADDQLSRWRLHREPAGPVGPPCSSLERLWSNEPGLEWTQAWQIYLLRLVGFVRQRDDSLMNWLWFVFLIFSVSQWSCDDFLWTFPDGRLSGVTDWLQPTWRRRAALQRANGGLKRRLAATRLQKSEEEVKNTSCLSGLPEKTSWWNGDASCQSERVQRFKTLQCIMGKICSAKWHNNKFTLLIRVLADQHRNKNIVLKIFTKNRNLNLSVLTDFTVTSPTAGSVQITERKRGSKWFWRLFDLSSGNRTALIIIIIFNQSDYNLVSSSLVTQLYSGLQDISVSFKIFLCCLVFGSLNRIFRTFCFIFTV